MDLEAIRQVLAAALPEAEIELNADGNRLLARISSEKFQGMNRVKRQQMIYALLGDRIESGEIHALSMETLTPEEKASRT